VDTRLTCVKLASPKLRASFKHAVPARNGGGGIFSAPKALLNLAMTAFAVAPMLCASLSGRLGRNADL